MEFSIGGGVGGDTWKKNLIYKQTMYLARSKKMPDCKWVFLLQSFF